MGQGRVLDIPGVPLDDVEPFVGLVEVVPVPEAGELVEDELPESVVELVPVVVPDEEGVAVLLAEVSEGELLLLVEDPVALVPGTVAQGTVPFGVVVGVTGVAVLAGGVAVWGVGEAVCAGGVAVCGVGDAVCAGGVAVCAPEVELCARPALADNTARANVPTNRKSRFFM